MTKSIGPTLGLTLNDLEKLSEHLNQIAPLINTQSLPKALANLLHAFADIDEISIIIYPFKSLPIIAYRDTSEPTSIQNLDTFILGAFVLDPYYVAATKKNKTGFFTLADLAPSGFRQSEYYKSYYRDAELEDECGYLFLGSSGEVINFSMAKNAGNKRFKSSELKKLCSLSGSISAFCSLHNFTCDVSTTDEHVGIRLELDSAIELFGARILTPREHEIISMILHGYAGKSIAMELGISLETIKLHRRNAYAKLEVGSQVELFYAFISLLTSSSQV